MILNIEHLGNYILCSHAVPITDEQGDFDTEKMKCNIDYKICDCTTCGIRQGFNRNNG